MILELIDRVAGWWMDWRTSRIIKGNPELARFEMTTTEQETTAVWITPAAAALADNLSTMLNQESVENYVQFDMIPRIDRKLRPSPRYCTVGKRVGPV